MKIHYEHIKLHSAVALIMVVMCVQSVFPLSEYSKRNMMCNKIQTMFDQALFPNTDTFFETVNRYMYNRTAESYGT